MLRGASEAPLERSRVRRWGVCREIPQAGKGRATQALGPARMQRTLIQQALACLLVAGALVNIVHVCCMRMTRREHGSRWFGPRMFYRYALGGDAVKALHGYVFSAVGLGLRRSLLK